MKVYNRDGDYYGGEKNMMVMRNKKGLGFLILNIFLNLYNF